MEIILWIFQVGNSQKQLPHREELDDMKSELAQLRVAKVCGYGVDYSTDSHW